MFNDTEEKTLTENLNALDHEIHGLVALSHISHIEILMVVSFFAAFVSQTSRRLEGDVSISGNMVFHADILVRHIFEHRLELLISHLLD